MKDELHYYPVRLNPDTIAALIATADKALLLLTNNYEYKVAEETDARDEYVKAKNDYGRAFYTELLKAIADKNVSATNTEKYAKSKASEQEFKFNVAEGTLKSLTGAVAVELEKIQSVKKLIDYRNRMESMK